MLFVEDLTRRSLIRIEIALLADIEIGNGCIGTKLMKIAQLAKYAMVGMIRCRL